MPLFHGMPRFHAYIQGDAGAGNPGDVLQGDQVGAVDAEEVGAEFFLKGRDAFLYPVLLWARRSRNRFMGDS